MSSISISQIRKNLPVYKEHLSAADRVKEKLLLPLKSLKTGDANYDRKIGEIVRKTEKEISQMIDLAISLTDVENNMKRLKNVSETASRKAAESLKKIEKLQREREERIKKAEKRIKALKSLKTGDDYYSEEALKVVKELQEKESLMYKDIDSFERFLEKAAEKIKENLLYSRIVEEIDIEDKKEETLDENQKLLMEEKKLKEKREEEEKALTQYLKASISALMEIGARQMGEVLLRQEKITRKQYSAFLEALFEEKEKESLKKITEEAKEEVIKKLALMGYTVEENGEETLAVQTEDPQYRVLIKIKNGQIAAKLIKLVGEENYTPSEYERIKDEELMEKWCSDLDRIKKELREKGFEVKEKVEVRKMEGVNYVYEPSMAVRKEKTERKMEK